MRNKEIKFRAWDKESNEMIYNIVIIDNKPYRRDCIGNIFGNNAKINGDIMRYTGFQDKNGKEICEGDIIYNQEYHIFEKVCFKEIEEFLYGHNRKFDCLILIDEYDSEEVLDVNLLNKFEVRGNIYENPELMEVEINE